MNDATAYILAAVIGYLLGSIPTGYLLAKARGVNIREVGSGSIGATNVSRGLGKLAGLFVLLIDVAKGVLAVTVVPSFMALHTAAFYAPAAGIGAVIGHNFPVWLRFRGGKGVATSLGVFAFLAPLQTVFALIAWLVTFLIWRFVSLASISAAVALVVFCAITPELGQFNNIQPPLGVAAFLATLLIVRHHENIKRLIAGTEPKFSFKKTETPPTDAPPAEKS